MAKFKFIGDIETIFHGLRHPDGSTVTAQPGAEVEVADAVLPGAALHPELEAVDDDAKKMVAAAEDKARIDASRVFGEPAPVEVTEGAPAPTEEPPAPAAESPAAPTTDEAPPPAT